MASQTRDLTLDSLPPDEKATVTFYADRFADHFKQQDPKLSTADAHESALDLISMIWIKLGPQTRAATMTHYWRLRCRLPERHGSPCRVLARGSMGSIMIEFEDGARYIVGWRSVRKRPLSP